MENFEAEISKLSTNFLSVFQILRYRAKIQIHFASFTSIPAVATVDQIQTEKSHTVGVEVGLVGRKLRRRLGSTATSVLTTQKNASCIAYGSKLYKNLPKPSLRHTVSVVKFQSQHHVEGKVFLKPEKTLNFRALFENF